MDREIIDAIPIPVERALEWRRRAADGGKAFPIVPVACPCCRDIRAERITAIEMALDRLQFMRIVDEHRDFMVFRCRKLSFECRCCCRALGVIFRPIRLVGFKLHDDMLRRNLRCICVLQRHLSLNLVRICICPQNNRAGTRRRVAQFICIRNGGCRLQFPCLSNVDITICNEADDIVLHGKRRSNRDIDLQGRLIKQCFRLRDIRMRRERPMDDNECIRRLLVFHKRERPLVHELRGVNGRRRGDDARRIDSRALGKQHAIRILEQEHARRYDAARNRREAA